MYSDTTAAPDRTVDHPTPASDREHLATVAFGLWMTVGLFFDGYFHQNLETDGESFLTPWHALFYSGFTAMVLWLAVLANRRGGIDWRLSRLPKGYSGARVGVVLFAVGGVGDALWHTAFGVERGIDALLSPTHLLLFAGLLLLLGAPAKAAAVTDAAPWVVVGSIVSATALVGFFVNFLWGLGVSAQTRVSYDPVTDAGETAVIAGVASTLVTTLVLFGATRLLLELRRPPAGSLAVLFGLVAVLVSAAFDEDVEGVVAAVAAGVVVDVMVRRTTQGVGVLRHSALTFTVGSAVLWGLYLGLLATGDGIAWPREISLGTIVMNVFVAAAIARFPGVGEGQADAFAA